MKTFEDVVDLFRSHVSRKRVAVVCPDDESTVGAIRRCVDDKLAEIILVTSGRESRELDEFMAVNSDKVRTVECTSVDDAARRGVALVREGNADVLMKGSINTDNLLRAVLDKECGLLQKGAVMSHLTAVDTPVYDRLIFFSDAAVIPRPTLEQFEAMIRYDVDICHKIGIAEPKVALIHFTEKVNSKFPHTLDYVELKSKAAAGEFGNAIVDGPMDVKTACDAHSGEMKGISSPVVGKADILIFPTLEASNTFYKTMSLFGRATMAGVICGTIAPVVVPSRADTADSKFYSLALACVAAG